MRGWLACVGIVLALLVAGCGSERDKGLNKDKDRPKPAETK